MPRPSSYAAHLRVYEPLDGFREPERTRWRQLLDAGQDVDGRVAAELEREAGLHALLGAVPRWLPAEAGLPAALVDRSGPAPRVCPLRTRVRSGLALAGFLDGLTPDLARAFAPDSVAAAVEDELEDHERRHGELKEHVLTETWCVPIPWFTLFEPTDRRLHVVEGQRPRMRYVAPMAKARQRAARTLDVLQRTIEGPVIERVETLGRWLEEFHPHALVELDYAGLTDLLTLDQLRRDTSVEDVREALQALADAEPVVAAEAYERVSVRWRHLGALATAS